MSRPRALALVAGTLATLYAAAPIYRQRYECRSCGFHGTREVAFPPSHIPCPRCGSAAAADGAAELVR